MTDEELRAALKQLAKVKGFGPLSPEEARRALDEAEPIPLSERRIKKIVAYATGRGPFPGRENGK